MQCIFIDSKTSVRQIRHQISSDNGESILIAGHEIRPDLAGYDARVLCLEEFGPDRNAVYQGMNEWLRRWSNEAVCAGRNIKQLLTYGGISIWWLMDCSLLWSRTTPPNMQELLYDFEAISMVLKQIRPTKVISFNSDHVFNRCLEICCRELSISTVKIPRQPWTRLRQAVRLRVLAAAHWIRFVARKLLFSVQRPLLANFSQRQGRPTVLVVSRDDWEPVHDLDSGALKLGERHYQPIIDRLRDEVDFCITVHLHSFRTVLKRPRQKGRSGCRFEPLEHAASLLRVWRAWGAVRRQWQLLRRSSELWESARYKGVDLSSILRYRCDAFMSGALVEAIIGLDAAGALMRREKPSLLLHGLETSSVGKAFIRVARQKGVPSLSLQHGTITEGHPAGTPLHSDVDLSYRSVDAWPFPDRMESGCRSGSV